MEDKVFFWQMACFVIICIFAMFAVRDVISPCKNNDAQVENALKANKDYEVEYASTTNEKFYQKIIGMEKNSTLVFNGFPTCLTSILHTHTQPGDEILTTEKDTLYLVDWDLNHADINKYPYYIVKDNNNNLWSIFRHNANFHLNRVDEIEHKDLLEIRDESNHEN